MIDKISAKQSGIQLPYLQVYLDLLYQEDYKKAYGEKELIGDLPPLVFTQEEVDDFGEIEEVINKFQQQQKIYLQKTLQKKHGDFPAHAVREVLDAFVTREGTKRPIYYYREKECIFIHPAYQKYFPDLDDSALSDVIQELEKVRLLRARADSYELAHDSLAKLIDEQRTDEERQRNEVFQQLLGNYTEHQMTNQFLTRKQLIYYENHLPFLKLNDDILEFIKDSENEARAEEEKGRKEQEEKIQIMEEKLAAEERARGRQQLYSGIIGIIAILTIISSVFAFLENQNARNELEQRKKEEIRRTLIEKEKIDLEIKELRSDAKTLYEGGRVLFSIKKLEMALAKDSTNQEVKEELEFYRQKIKNKNQ